jgi:predicted SprT family Zn-dependent metalloprotease
VIKIIAYECKCGEYFEKFPNLKNGEVAKKTKCSKCGKMVDPQIGVKNKMPTCGVK